jgi:dTDP-4-dehydrorhamnose reductase
MSKFLVLGDGKLANEIIRQQPHWYYISRKKDGFDFRYIHQYAGYLKNYDVVINCIADTNTYSTDRQSIMNVNYKAVADLADYCEVTKKKLCHISTDYVYANNEQVTPTEEDLPIPDKNWYAYSKLLADNHIQMRMANYLITRCSFKMRPFPYTQAVNQVGNFDYLDVIAGLIIKLIKRDATGLFNVGTQLKSMVYLAQQSNPNVEDAPHGLYPMIPENVAMDVSKMNKFLGIEK